MKLASNMGMLLLGIWLGPNRRTPALGYFVPRVSPLMEVLAVAAGVLILMNK